MAETPDVPESTHAPGDDAFIASWRADLLERVWRMMEAEQLRSGKPYHTVLLVRVQNPEVRSPELAELVGEVLKKPMKAGAVRVLLHRAREKFGEMLLDEVENSLTSATSEAVEQELIDLDLWQYCKPALEKRREQT